MSDKKTDLRKQAEGKASHLPDDLDALSPEELRLRLHELRVHQIELEMQNEDLRQAHLDLGEARTRYFDLYDLAPVGYCTISEKGLILEANLTVATMLGLTHRGALAKLPLSQYIFKEDHDIYYLHRKQLFETDEPQPCELRMVKMDGTLFWACIETTAAKGTDGAPTYRMVISNITGRIETEKELRISQEQLRDAHRLAHIGIWNWNADTDTVIWTEELYRIAGLDSMAPAPTYTEQANLYAPESWNRLQKAVEKALETGEPYQLELELIRTDGITRIVNAFGGAMCDKQGRTRGLYGTVQDITERKRAEEVLREQKERFRLITETIDEVFWMADVEIGKMFYISPSYERVWGRSREDLYENPKSFLDSVHVEDRERVIAGLTIEKSGQPFAHEYRIVLPNGTIRHIWDRGFPVHNEEGQVYNYAGIAIDITEQKQSEASLKLRLQLLEFSATHSVEELLQKALDGIGELTDSPIGFYHFVEADEKTLSLQAWSTRTEREFCAAAGKGLHYGIEQAGVWVDSIRERRPVIHNDYSALPHRQGLPPGHAAVIRELTMPIFRGGKIVAILGIGNKPVDYTEADLRMVSFLADVTWEIVRKKMAEKELRESEVKFQLIFDTTLEGIYQSTPEGRYIIVNPAFAHMLGYESPKDLMETVINIGQQLYVDSNRRNEIKHLLATEGTAEGFEAQLYRKDRSTIWVIINAMAVKDEKEDILYYQGGMIDITERKRAEDELKSAHMKLESLWNVSSLSGANTKVVSDHILESIARMTQSEYGFYGFINDDESVMIIHSWSGEAMKDCSMVDKPQHFPISKAGVWAEAIRRREPLILNDYAATGMAKKGLPEGHVELTNLMVVPHFTQDRITSVAAVANRHVDYNINDVNQITAFLNSVQTIVDSKQAEEAVRESQQRLMDIIEFLPDATLVIDKDGKVIAWNRAIEAMTGVRAEAMLGKGNYEYALPFYGERKPILIDIALHPDLTKEESYTTIRRKGDVVFGEAYTPTLASGNIHLSGTASVLRNSTGEIVGAIECIRNNTDRKNMEERLQRAEKMESLGTLAGGVAHDLNNVLGIVVGYAEMLMDEMDEANPMRNDLKKILEGGNRSAAIVQDLLTLARRGVQTKKTLNLNAAITDCQKLPEFEKVFSDNRQVKLQTDLESDLLNITGSPVHLAKSIINLAANAVEAMPNGGVLKIATANQYMDVPIQGYDKIREGDYVVLTVSDTGEGILERDIKRIFEPFYTKKIMGRSGTGLGLAVVWGTIKDHNGYIDVHSEVGKGTIFSLYFPVTREEIAKTEIVIPLSDYIGNDESILVIDDINEQRELATKILGKLNYKVNTVSSGEEAVQYLRAEKADLIILDMIMDPGMDGLDTYKAILEIHPKQKAIIVSGFSETDRVKEAKTLGAGYYLRKPYVQEKLGMAVRKELDRK